MFDTNRTYDEESFKYMVENKRISAFGDRKGAAACFTKNDYAFYSHKGWGIVLGGKITGKLQKEDEEWYYKVEFLTPIPQDLKNFKNHKVLTFGEVSRILNKRFYWARINKTPYLTKEESEKLINELKY